MGQIIDGKAMAEKIKQKVRREIAESCLHPQLTVICVGNDLASAIYVRGKEKDCKECGIECKILHLDENVDEVDLLWLIEAQNQNKDVDGILVQLPLPAHINTETVMRKIALTKDVDCFNPTNVARLAAGRPTILPCTPMAVLTMLKKSDVDVEGKHCVVVGRSKIVGEPLSRLLLQNNATVTVCHSKTKNLSEITRMADVLIAAVGKEKLITSDIVKEGVVVIDVGINRGEDGKVHGDVDFEEVKEKASLITPVPGGVGLMTRAMLMDNVLLAARRNQK